MTIDEAIACEMQKAKEQRNHIGTFDEEYSKKCEVYAEEHEQLVEWLEELKANKNVSAEVYEQGYKRGYDKAVDDFANICKENILCKTFGLREVDIDKIAEQLKADIK